MYSKNNMISVLSNRLNLKLVIFPLGIILAALLHLDARSTRRKPTDLGTVQAIRHGNNTNTTADHYDDRQEYFAADQHSINDTKHFARYNNSDRHNHPSSPNHYMKHEHISNDTALDKEEVSSRASKISTSPTLKKQDAAAPKPLICTKCKTGMCYTGESFPMIPRVHIEGSTLIAADIAYNARSSDSTDWGNVLSIYWAGRTMAHLGGYQYQGGKIVKSITWMDYLPKNAPAHYGKMNYSKMYAIIVALKILAIHTFIGVNVQQVGVTWYRLFKMIHGMR